MKECAYGKEPLDVKLMSILILKKIKVFLAATIIGGLLVGGIYFVSQILLGEGVTYEATSTYYVEYGTDPLTNQEFTYINGVTWDTVWVKSDTFLAQVLEKAGDAAQQLTGTELTAERLKGYLSAALPSDLRIPTTTVKTESRELTMLLAEAVEETMVAFGAGDENREINEIRVLISPQQAERTVIDNRTWSAVILGAVLGLFAAVVLWLIGYFLDDSIYVPTTFEYRYGIPMLGTLSSPFTVVNFKHFFREKNTVAVLGVDEESDMQAVSAELNKLLAGKQMASGTAVAEPETIDGIGAETSWELVPMPGLEQCPEVVETLRIYDSVLLCVEAGAHDGKRIQEQLNLLTKQEIPVTAALLLHEDESLQKLYY